MGTPADANPYEHTEIVNAMHKLEEIGIYRMVRPWLLSDFIFRFTAKGREEEKYRNILHQFTEQVIKMRRQALAIQQYCEDFIDQGLKKRAIFMDLLIASSDGGKHLSDQDIREEVNTFMFAGQNTTQLAINYCLYLLGENPDVEDKAYAELNDIFGDSERQPTMEDLKNMKYLENCIKEALRLFPSVPVIARKLTEDEVFGKYTLPKGSDVLVLPYVLHRDPAQFPDPESFNPDNFLPEAVKCRHPYAYIPFSAGPRNCIGHRWHSHRKLITPTFHFNILESFVDVFVARTQDFMGKLKASLADNQEEFINISPFTRKLTLDFICETAMGTPADANPYEHTEIVNAMHRLEEIGIYRMVRPWLLSDFIFRFTAKGREEEKYRNILHQFTDQVIKMRRQALAKQQYCEEFIDQGLKKRAIFMDLLIASSDGGKHLSDQDIREEVNTFMFAGQNTTQLTINYCLYLLGENPDIQDKAYAELNDIFGDSERQPTMEDLKNMKYLENCIKEALRLFPSVPVIARKLTEDEVFGKYTLPKGSDVLVLPYVLHRDPAQFPNPESFNPDNFLPEAVKCRHPYAYIPFSAGPRNCIGQKFAVLAEKTVLSAILRKYEVRSLHSRQELIVVPNTVLVPKTGIKLKLISRSTI